MAAGEGKDACSGVPSSEVFPDLDIKHVDPTDSIPAVDGVGPGFYDWRVVFPFLDAVLSLRAELAEEAKSTPWWYDWPEQSLYSKEDGMDWKVMPFCHTFPANQPENRTWVDKHTQACPKIARVLQAIPGVRTALLSRLGAGTVLSVHQGWAILSNHVLRCHLPLDVPDLPSKLHISAGGQTSPSAASPGPGFTPHSALPDGEDADLHPLSPPGGSCGLVVDSHVTYHSTEDIVVFDDSHRHYAFNKHPSKDRLILIFDIARPDSVPPGVAVGETTEQLQGFIDHFT